ncbi:hypothetical protein AB0B78_25695 [Streptomyces sp. NPDC040724]|uniref:hypothetical protein n=1 Tax=Streptomyces sp. NPDC040724 TaxID=3155612 RepID=UPI0033E72253
MPPTLRNCGASRAGLVQLLGQAEEGVCRPIWPLVKRHIGNLAAANLDQLTRAVKHKLKQIQYRPHLIDGCIASTELIMDG